MKHTNPILVVALGVMTATGIRVGAQTRPALKVFTAVEVEFETEVGKAYKLQGAVNLTNWTDLGNAVLGNGRRVNHIFSSRSGEAVDFATYRLRMDDGPTNGFAPWSFAGLTLNLDDQPGGDLTQFLTETNGVDLGGVPEPFSYVFSRLGLDDVRVELTGGGYSEGIKRDLYVFTFSTPAIGTWARDEYRNGLLKGHDQGVFSVVSGGSTNNPSAGTNAVPTVPPVSLAGLVYLFQSGLTPDRLDFLTETNGIEFEDNARPGDDHPGRAFAYTYTLLTSNSATLQVNQANDRRDEYDLTFTLGAQGTFTRREFRSGVLDDTDTGSFSPSAQAPVVPPGGTNNPPVTNAPPVSPVGYTYTILSGAVSERLVFQTTTGGVQFDDSAPTQFTFSYNATGENTVHLLVQFKPDKWDDYALTFTSGIRGSFVRQQFDRNALKNTDSGPFSLAPTN